MIMCIIGGRAHDVRAECECDPSKQCDCTGEGDQESPPDAPGEGDPVYLFSGEFYHEVEDLRIPGRGFDFVWSRKYRSRAGEQTGNQFSIGQYWFHSYGMRLRRHLLSQDLVLHDDNGRVDRFRFQPDGSWTRSETFAVINREADLSYTLTHADGTKWNFRPLDQQPSKGRISSIVDRNGNTMHFSYQLICAPQPGHDCFDVDLMGAGCSDPCIQECVCDIDSFCCDIAWDEGCANFALNSCSLPIITETDRLRVITDTLGRSITFAYDSDGYIETITDFAGRQIRYEYFANGDLKSASSPSIVASPEFPIPQGHEFPNGKTINYTYGANHRLLGIVDAKGTLYLVNTFDQFGRCIDQLLGNGRFHYHYVTNLNPSDNNGATKKTILSDRAGHVSEVFFDPKNREVMRREFTGLADPTLPTTETDNRPTGKLRPDDPDYFETRYQFNADALTKKVTYPNGNIVEYIYESDLIPAADARVRGNLREVHRLPGPLGADQTQIDEYFEYLTGYGGDAFITRAVDGRGNATLHHYDDRGNRIRTQHRIPGIEEEWEYNTFGQMTSHILPDNGSSHRRRDEFTYYTDPLSSQNGFREKLIVDAGNLQLTTRYEYNIVGNVRALIDPRGNDTTYIHNQLNQIVRKVSREVTPGMRYQEDTYYDHNNNVVRVDTQHCDESSCEQANAQFTTIHEYDLLDNRIRTCRENYASDVNVEQRTCDGLQPPAFVITEFVYDANENLTLEKLGEAVNGNDPSNTVRFLYDERDILWRRVRGETDGTVKSTTQFDYDGNRNLKAVREGIEQDVRLTTSLFDGFDRLSQTMDPMGNIRTLHYDANGNRVTERIDGELVDVHVGSFDNVRLSETSMMFDFMDRQILHSVAFFKPATQEPIGDGVSTTQTVYSDNSQVVKMIDDNGNETRTVYDTANRRTLLEDAKHNTIAFTYDDNSNVIGIIETEKSDLGTSDEVFQRTQVYDALDRLIESKDNVENSNQFYYDSRNNRTRLVDALGNETRYIFDGLNRPIRTVRDLNGNGAAPGAMPGDDNPDIVTAQSWDDSSRLIGQIDDSGNVTRYIYDALNRKSITRMADGTLHQTGTGAAWLDPQALPDLSGFVSGYDVHDNAKTTLDANGSLVLASFDELNRPQSKIITPGSGVSNDITQEIYHYDGLSRLVRAQDDDSFLGRAYDSMSNMIEESLDVTVPFDGMDARVINSVFDGVGNKALCTYPGGRQIAVAFDALNRKKTISDDNGLLATYYFVGPSRVTVRSYRNGTTCGYEYDGVLGTTNPENDFGFKHVVRSIHVGPSGVIDDRSYTWDRMGNKTRRKDEQPAVMAGLPRLTHEYSYDRAYRLVRTLVTDNSLAVPAVVRDTEYELDGVHNRQRVASMPHLGEGDGTYTMDSGSPPADEQVNQYTFSRNEMRVYDNNGNLTDSNWTYPLLNQNFGGPAVIPPICNGDNSAACRQLDEDEDLDLDLVDFAQYQNIDAPRRADIEYDYRNQMVSYYDLSSDRQHNYRYDALGRRIAKIVDAEGLAPDEIRFLNDGWQIVEEQNAAGNTVATYVYGLYIDEVLNMRRNVEEKGSLEDYFYHSDEIHNVMVITDDAGIPVECYEYGDYGQPTITNCGNAMAPVLPTNNRFTFNGRDFDKESSLYYYRTRYLDYGYGRFTVRDSIGIWGALAALGNGYSYCGENPWSTTDAFGQDGWRFGGAVVVGAGAGAASGYLSGATLGTLAGPVGTLAGAGVGAVVGGIVGAVGGGLAELYDALKPADAITSKVNLDGSKTDTWKTPNGDGVSHTQNLDGTSETRITAPDGSQIIDRTRSDGSRITMETASNGRIFATTTTYPDGSSKTEDGYGNMEYRDKNGNPVSRDEWLKLHINKSCKTK